MDDGDASTDEEVVRRAVRDELLVHVRLHDQGLAPTADQRAALAERLPALRPFGTNRFAAVRAVLDWDHQVPSRLMLLRLFACYSEHETRRVDAGIRACQAAIDHGNVYPEFDVGDFGDVDASEVYAGVIEAGSMMMDDLRFLSDWRKRVAPEVGRNALEIVKHSATYRDAMAQRRIEGLGGPLIVGWTPPCLADAHNWAIEVWLVTDFDGHSGKARVFMVDTQARLITRELETVVQIA